MNTAYFSWRKLILYTVCSQTFHSMSIQCVKSVTAPSNNVCWKFKQQCLVTSFCSILFCFCTIHACLLLNKHCLGVWWWLMPESTSVLGWRTAAGWSWGANDGMFLTRGRNMLTVWVLCPSHPLPFQQTRDRHVWALWLIHSCLGFETTV